MGQPDTYCAYGVCGKWDRLQLKQFFSEEKNQKTFASLARVSSYEPQQRHKSFLVLFFKKEDLSFHLLPTNPAAKSASIERPQIPRLLTNAQRRVSAS